jgi:hypothetical protein
VAIRGRLVQAGQDLVVIERESVVTAIAQGKSAPPRGFTVDDDGSQKLAMTVTTRLAVWLAAILAPWAVIAALASWI